MNLVDNQTRHQVKKLILWQTESEQHAKLYGVTMKESRPLIILLNIVNRKAFLLSSLIHIVPSRVEFQKGSTILSLKQQGLWSIMQSCRNILGRSC